MMGENTFYNEFAKSITTLYSNLDQQQAAKYVERIAAVFKSASELLCGNLFVICLDRKQDQNLRYASHSYGTPCKCRPVAEADKVLDLLQQDCINQESRCPTFYDDDIMVPQYRLYLPDIRPGMNHKIYMLSALPKADRKIMKAAVKVITSEIHEHYLESVKAVTPRA